MKRHLILPLFLGLLAPLLFAQKAPEKPAVAAAPAWEHQPITLDGIDAAGVAALVKNPTKKLRLINVWATWCVPCVAEFPELVKLSRETKGDDFEVITISMDHPRKERDKALKFLEERRAGMSAPIAGTLKAEGRTSNNYIYTQLSQTPLIDALDPQWPGPIPHTILVAPGGEIVWRHNGEFDPVVLGRIIREKLGAK